MVSEEELIRSEFLSPANRDGKALRRKPVKFMGRDVWAWGLGAEHHAAIEQSRIVLSKGGAPGINLKHFRALAVVYGLRRTGEENARRIFVDNDEGYVNQLPAEEVNRVAELVFELSGMRPADQEEARKNSSAPDLPGASSASPSDLAGHPSPGDSPTSAPSS